MRPNATGWRRGIAAIGLVLVLTQVGFAQETDKNKVRYWLERYGEYQGPLRERIDEVFEKVAAAADKRADRYPKFAPIEKEGDPYAVALPDGGIVLTTTALDICYPDGVATGPEGDAKLAFVLGHELSHLATDDAYHQEMFELVQRFMGPEERVRARTDLIAQRPNLRQIELRADGYGLIYAAMAGYDAGAVVAEEGEFFRDWVKQVFGRVVYSRGGQAKVDERVAFLRARAASVRSEIRVFEAGVAAYLNGEFARAVNYFEEFATEFPSREVLSNLGLSHYQIAARSIGECDGRLLLKYMLPVELDSSTRATRLRSGSPADTRCMELDDVRSQLDQSRIALELSVERDPTYAPARVNLASLESLARRWSSAIAAVDEAVLAGADSIPLAIVNIIANFEYGMSSDLELDSWALGELAKLAKSTESQHDAMLAAYNAASISANPVETLQALGWAGRKVQSYPKLYRNALRDILGPDKK